MVGVVICAYGQEELTRTTLEDIGRPRVEHVICVVDNGGTFSAPEFESVEVLRPGRNLGWARGSNYGVQALMADRRVDAFVLLNNDVRLSRAFIDGLYEAWRETGGSVVAPVYDHNWPQQRIDFGGRPAQYVPTPGERLVPFVDGTCMLVTRRSVEVIGYLDEECWPEWSWGCDKDFCLRIRESGGSIFVTTRAYLAHAARGTAASMPDFSEERAERENDAGMVAKWGASWRDRLYDGFDEYTREGLVQCRLKLCDD